MDIKYRIWLLLQILPFGIIAGFAGVTLTIMATAIKNRKAKVSQIFLPKNIFLAFGTAFYFTYVLGISFFHSSRISSPGISFPFAQFTEALLNRSSYLLFNVLINVIIFIPFGCFFPLIYRRINSYSRIFSISLLCSCCIELIQMITHRGLFSCDDVIGNVIGAMLGFGTVKIIQGLRKKPVSFIKADTKKGISLYIVLLILTSSVFIFGFIYCAANTASDNVYYSYVEKQFNENKNALLDYARSGNYSDFPDIKEVRDMAHSNNWFRLELGRSFNGTDLIYYGLFYVKDTSKIQNSIINEGNIGYNAGSCFYDADDGMHYELKQIQDGFFYYKINY